MTVTFDEFATESIIGLFLWGRKRGKNRSARLIYGASGAKRRAGSESGPQKVRGPGRNPEFSALVDCGGVGGLGRALFNILASTTCCDRIHCETSVTIVHLKGLNLDLSFLLNHHDPSPTAMYLIAGHRSLGNPAGAPGPLWYIRIWCV